MCDTNPIGKNIQKSPVFMITPFWKSEISLSEKLRFFWIFFLKREGGSHLCQKNLIIKHWETTRKQYTLRLWAIEGGPLGKEGKGKEKEEDGDKENKSDTRNKKQTREGEREVRKGIG